jgi:glyoxylase-like metal-dependent hydrolase (beta-lactamase superfamily II)
MSELISSRRSVLKSALGLAAAASLPAGAFAKSSPKAAVTATALNDRLLLVSGLGGNVLALRGDEGLLLVDTGAAGATSKLQAELKKFARGAKVTTVINTHWHPDHTGGNDVFAKAGAKIISHAKVAQRMAVDQYVPWEDRYLKARAKLAVPTEVFYLGKKELKFGGETLEYGYLQQPHTDGDIYVHFRESNVLAVGDAASPQLDPQICWYEGGWVGGRVDSQARLLAMGTADARIVAGTGGVIGRTELKAERDALEKLFDRMSDAMRKGFTTEDMQKAKLLDGLTRTWADPDKFIYDAHKSMWAHYNKLSHTIV